MFRSSVLTKSVGFSNFSLPFAAYLSSNSKVARLMNSSSIPDGLRVFRYWMISSALVLNSCRSASSPSSFNLYRSCLSKPCFANLFSVVFS